MNRLDQNRTRSRAFLLCLVAATASCRFAPPPPPQYNITFEPNESRDPLVLIPDQLTEITFWIGEPVQDSPSDLLTCARKSPGKTERIPS